MLKKTELKICLTKLEIKATRLFARTITQWHRGFNGWPERLDYQSIKMVAKPLKVKVDIEVLTCIQIMEQAIIKEASRRAKQSRT